MSLWNYGGLTELRQLRYTFFYKWRVLFSVFPACPHRFRTLDLLAAPEEIFKSFSMVLNRRRPRSRVAVNQIRVLPPKRIPT